MKKWAKRFEEALRTMDRVTAHQVFYDPAFSEPVEKKADLLIVPALERIGVDWQEGKISLAQVYMCSRICEEIMEGFFSAKDTRVKIDQPLIGVAVLEDFHTLGKRLVTSSLTLAGYSFEDFGVQRVEELASKVTAGGIQVLLISVLMYPSVLRIKDLRAIFNKKGYAVKLIVGGAPFALDPALWKQVGADAMGLHASQAIKLVQNVTGGGE